MPSSPFAPFESMPVTRAGDREPVQSPVSAPVVFPAYEILDELGRGGMGVVYRARQRSLNRLVALKVILGGPLASSEDKARFRIEAEAAARLHHPNIVQVYDVGEHAGFSYMALELIEGQTLRQWQNGQPLEPRLAASLVSAVARAIQHAHEQGIVHRDLKPANILLAPVPGARTDFPTAISTSTPVPVSSGLLSRPQSGTFTSTLSVSPKVTDFGLAKPLEGGSDLTVTGVACGTPNYMAPEQVRGKALSPRVDVYGLGAVLYELLAGRPAFVGSDAAEVMNLILKTEAPPLRKFVPGVPRDLAVIVAKCLEKDPARRYSTAREMADDLDRFLTGKPIAARPVGVTERGWRWVKRNPVIATFLFISTLGCTVTGGLAVALARSAANERNERAAAESAREEAENTRDRLKIALAAAEEARGLAVTERKAADAARESARQDAANAVLKKKEADVARARAEDSLRVARGVIRVSLRELSRNPRFEDEEYRDARLMLIKQVRTFRDAVTDHAPNTSEWLDDIAEVSHWLGYLEYLNNNQDAAAAEYRTAADAAGRWAKLEPQKPEPRFRQSFSLVNAGNALINSRRYTEAEKCYRDAMKLIDGVVAEYPREAFYRRQSVETYGQLTSVLRAMNQLAEAEKIGQVELELARDLIHICGEAPDNLRWLAHAQVDLGKTLTRLQKWSDAECSFADAVATRDRIVDLDPNVPRNKFEYAAALLAHANFLQMWKQPERAGDTFVRAVATLEKTQAAAPSVNLHCTDLASGWTQYAEFLRTQRRFAEAEQYYNRALDMAALVLRRAPTFRAAREVWVTAAVGRAHLYNHTGRHREAVAEWARLAKEDPDLRIRPRHELFAMQSLLFAGDWKAAQAAAETQMKKEQPGWMWIDLGRVWCLSIRQIETDQTMTPAEKLSASERAISKAVACLEKAKAAGEFASAERVKWFVNNSDFSAIHDKIDVTKK